MKKKKKPLQPQAWSPWLPYLLRLLHYLNLPMKNLPTRFNIASWLSLWRYHLLTHPTLKLCIWMMMIALVLILKLLPLMNISLIYKVIIKKYFVAIMSELAEANDLIDKKCEIER